MITFDHILGQNPAVDFLRSACADDRLPHALIFAGPVGVGKATCALALAGRFLCHKPKANEPCGVCESCRLLTAGNHPDYHVIVKEMVREYDKTGKSKAIDLSIHVIRGELVTPAAHTAVFGHGKFFVVEQAELMNLAAQNALLKTLEEPPGKAVIVLLTDAPEYFLPTVRSRCQMVRFAPLEMKLAQRLVEKKGHEPAIAAAAAELSDGSPGGALRLIAQGTLPLAAELDRQIEQLLAGHAPADLSGWLKKAADAHAVVELERDPLGSKDAATKAGLAMYLHLAARRFRRQLHETSDPTALERACRAIDAITRCQMYLDGNVNVAVALGQLAAAWAEEFAVAG